MYLNKIKIKDKLKDDKGVAGIEEVIAILFLLIFICFSTDAILVASKQYIASQQTNLIARTLGVQGGIKSNIPTGYQGDTISYVTSSKMYEAVKSNMEKIGIDDWKVEITTYTKNGRVASKKVLSPTTNITADYGIGIDVALTYSYKWNLINQIIPGNADRTTTNKVGGHSVSEFKYDYDNWDGEKR